MISKSMVQFDKFQKVFWTKGLLNLSSPDPFIQPNVYCERSV